MHKHVEILIGRLATDPELLNRFAQHPHDLLRELGLELSVVETEALVAINIEALRAFTNALDARLRKASLEADDRLARITTITESERDSR